MNIQPGETFTMAEVEGPGAVQHIWMTPTGDRRLSIMRMYWDGEEEILFMMRPELFSQITKNITDGDIIDSIPEEIVSNIGRELINLGVCVVLIKSGKLGTYFFTGDVRSLKEVPGITLSEDLWNHREIRSHAYRIDPARVRNESGAGDVAVAGFLTAILKSNNPEPALKYALCAGRNNLYGMHATDGLTDWETMTKELNPEGWR